MSSKYVISWVARILALVYALMLAGGWWDEMQARNQPGNSDLPAIIAFDRYAILTHLLPLAILIAGIAIGWRRPLWGAIAFGIYAALGVVAAWGEWIYLPLVSGPAVLIAAMYVWSMPRRS